LKALVFVSSTGEWLEAKCIHLYYCEPYVDKIYGRYKQINYIYFIFMKKVLD